MEIRIPLWVLIVRHFRVERSAREGIEQWEIRIKKMIAENTINDKWGSEIYMLYMYCHSNKVSYVNTCDPSNNFVPFMNNWIRGIYIKPAVNEDTRKLIRQAVHLMIVSMPTELSLTEQLLRNANLDFNCKKKLILLEKELEDQINGGKISMEKTIATIKSFCRDNVSASGYYDHKGNISSIVSDWYDYLYEKHLVTNNRYDFRPCLDLTFLDDAISV